MNHDHITCPCKRTQCERHGNCAACKLHHHMPKKKLPTACERIAAKDALKNAKDAEITISPNPTAHS